MYPIAALIAVAVLSLLITRVATVALTLTGMTREGARFQARSALTGVGFTTTEAEAVVSHPVRRRVIMALMLLGSAGLVTAIAGLLAGFVDAGGGQAVRRTVLLAVGLWGVYAAAKSQRVDRVLSRLISRVLQRYTDLDARDYSRLLHIQEQYSVNELHVPEGGLLADRSLGELLLRDEGVMVLGITRPDDTYLGVPTKDSVLRAGDTAVVYGHADAIAQLNRRRQGDPAASDHDAAVREHADRLRRQEQAERTGDDRTGRGSG